MTNSTERTNQISEVESQLHNVRTRLDEQAALGDSDGDRLVEQGRRAGLEAQLVKLRAERDAKGDTCQSVEPGALADEVAQLQAETADLRVQLDQLRGELLASRLGSNEPEIELVPSGLTRPEEDHARPSSLTRPEEDHARPSADGRDDLTRLKGIGPKVQEMLNEQGVIRFDQLADLSPADVERIGANLGAFKGRIDRYEWIQQARAMAEDD